MIDTLDVKLLAPPFALAVPAVVVPGRPAWRSLPQDTTWEALPQPTAWRALPRETAWKAKG